MANLYHYTTGAGLLGMMKNYSEKNKNLTMWATHYMYMNDPTEYLFGENICLDVIDEIETELNVEKEFRIKGVVTTDNAKLLQRKVMRFLHSFDPQKIRTCPYFISLSMARDSLHMWDMYATNGNGIAIVFNKERLSNYYELEKCIYPKRKQDYSDIKQRIEKLYEEFSTNEYSSLEVSIERACTISNMISLMVGIYIKHHSYKEEKEIRLIAPYAHQILFRDKKGLIIPYVEQQIPFECVENIIIGPTADFNRVRESILLLMNSIGIIWDEDKIIKSKVPYRV